MVVIKKQTSTPLKVEVQLFDNWRELEWCPKILHHNAAPPTYVPRLLYMSTPRVTCMQEQRVCVTHAYNKETNQALVFNALSNGKKKGIIVKYRYFPHLTRLISPTKPKAYTP